MIAQKDFTDIAPFMSLIDQSRFEEAKHGLNLVDAKSKTSKRMKNYVAGKIAFHQSDFRTAIHLFNQTKKEFGHHISLFSEIACCFYLQGDFFRWAHAVDELETEFNKIKDILSFDSQSKTLLLLGKFKEEQAHVYDALMIYEELYEKNEDAQFMPVILSQLLRLQSYYGIKKNLSTYYNQLMLVNQQFFLNNINIEVQHALMLAEIELFSIEEGLKRLSLIINDETLSLSDKKLFVYDFIERALWYKNEIPAWLIEIESSIQEKDLFEQIIHELLLDKKDEVLKIITKSQNSNMPLSSTLKILIYQMSLAIDPTLKRKWNLMVDSLNHQSLKIWNQRFQSVINTNEDEKVTIRYDRKTKVIYFKDKSLNLSKKKAMINFWEAIFDQKDMLVENVVKTLWQADYNESYYHRLRMMAKRLNEILADLTAIPELIKVTTEKVQISVSLSAE